MTEEDEHLQALLSEAVDTMHEKQRVNNRRTIPSATNANQPRDKEVWRDLAAYWILGMCNNYGYVVMLSAAHDIIERFADHQSGVVSAHASRECSLMSTGVLLLADTIPSMTMKLIAPFLPFYIHVRMSIACVLSAVSFILVADAPNKYQAILGIVFTSISCGLGESSLLAYTSKFGKNVISTWSSGTGAAGVAGALTYAALISLGFTPKSTLLLMLVVPLLEAITFFFLLRNPKRRAPGRHPDMSPSPSSATIEESLISSSTVLYRNHVSPPPLPPPVVQQQHPLLGVKAKVKYIPKLFKYLLPLFTVYLCEYFINQGLYELIHFRDIWLDHAAQYRWLQVDYQIGVFLSRSSVNLFAIKNIWLMSFLQFVNIFYFAGEAVYLFTPTIWIVFAFVFWEGLLGGACYVNTFYRMSKEVPITHQKFALGVVPIGESFGIVIAGLLAIPVHNYICTIPVPRQI